MYERFSPRTAQVSPLTDAQFVEAAEQIPPPDPGFIPVDAAAPAADGVAAASTAGAVSALAGILKNLTGRLHLQDITVDDLLLLGILILILRKNAEWDVLLIMAVLFFLGMFESSKT